MPHSVTEVGLEMGIGTQVNSRNSFGAEKVNARITAGRDV